ncbi:MAG: ATP-binding protein [bacterium]|nr:ATP-binding protein [bacterium]
MTKEGLFEKLEDIEWEDFEVKAAGRRLPKTTWETVSAFSNTSGGWLVFGVTQTKEGYDISGVEFPEKLEQDLITTLRGEKFNCRIHPMARKYVFDEKIVLAFHIPRAATKPVYFNVQTNSFIRTGSGDQRATKEEIDAMYREQAFGTKDRETTAYSYEDLNRQTIESYKTFDESTPQNCHHCRRLRLPVKPVSETRNLDDVECRAGAETAEDASVPGRTWQPSSGI